MNDDKINDVESKTLLQDAYKYFNSNLLQIGGVLILLLMLLLILTTICPEFNELFKASGDELRKLSFLNVSWLKYEMLFLYNVVLLSLMFFFVLRGISELYACIKIYFITKKTVNDYIKTRDTVNDDEFFYQIKISHRNRGLESKVLEKEMNDINNKTDDFVVSVKTIGKHAESYITWMLIWGFLVLISIYIFQYDMVFYTRKFMNAFIVFSGIIVSLISSITRAIIKKFIKLLEELYGW